MVHIIAVKHIEEFIAGNPKYKKVLEAWVSIVISCTWDKPQDIVEQFGAKAIDILGKKDNKKTTTSSNRVVIDIKGNQLRVIAKYQFHPSLKKSRLYLKWIGTHNDYDKICKSNAQYDIDIFKKVEGK